MASTRRLVHGTPRSGGSRSISEESQSFSTSGSDCSEAEENVEPWMLPVYPGDAVCERPELPCKVLVADETVMELGNELMHSKLMDKQLPMSWCVGPTIIPLFQASICQVLFCTFLAASGVSVARCNADGSSEMRYVLWIPMSLYCMFDLYNEIWCLKHCSVPYIQVAREYSILCFRISFTWWFLINAGTSVVSILGSVTQTLSAATSMHCKAVEGLEEQWHRLFSESIVFRWLQDLEPWTVITFLWVCTQLHVVHAVLISIPNTRRNEKRLETKVTTDTGSDGTFFYFNLFGEGMTTGTTFCTLACGNGYCLIQAQNPRYPIYRAQRQFETLVEMARAGTLENKARKIEQYMQHAAGEMSRAEVRLFYAGIFKVALQAHIQVTRYMLVRATQKELGEESGLHGLVLTIVLSILPFFAMIGYTINICQFTRQTIRNAQYLMDEGITSVDDSVVDDQPTIGQYVWKLRLHMIWVIILFLSVLILTVFAIIRFYMAVFVCEDVLWILTFTSDLAEGCLSS